MNYGLRHGTVHKLTSGSSSSASSAFSANIEYIRVVGTIACHIHIAVSPTATTSTTYLPAGEVEAAGEEENETHHEDSHTFLLLNFGKRP